MAEQVKTNTPHQAIDLTRLGTQFLKIEMGTQPIITLDPKVLLTSKKPSVTETLRV
jgi:hypothetical protein